MTNDAEVASLLARAGVPGALERLWELRIEKGHLIGWGLPEEFDAYSDGSVNPVNTIYSYTTALAGLAFQEAGDIERAWEAAKTLLSLITPDDAVWYSDQPCDQRPGYEVPNVAGISLALFARLGLYAAKPTAAWLREWQGRELDTEHEDYHPANWRYRIGHPQPTDLFHETLIAFGLSEAGEWTACGRSIGGMLATHFHRDGSPHHRHTRNARDTWGPSAFSVLCPYGDRFVTLPAGTEEGRNREVADAWARLAIATQLAEAEA